MWCTVEQWCFSTDGHSTSPSGFRSAQPCMPFTWRASLPGSRLWGGLHGRLGREGKEGRGWRCKAQGRCMLGVPGGGLIDGFRSAGSGRKTGCVHRTTPATPPPPFRAWCSLGCWFLLTMQCCASVRHLGTVSRNRPSSSLRWLRGLGLLLR
jgi:hypothetical protein